jgi:integrase
VAQPTTRPVAAPLSLFDYPSDISGVNWEPEVGDDPYKKHKRAILLEADGSPWIHGNLFLLHVLKNNVHHPSTDIKKAEYLQEFRNILNKLKIDYLSDSKLKSKRPTYALKTELANKVKNGFSRKHANMIVGAVVEFYDWLKAYTIHTFSYPLYKKKVFISYYTDEAGFQYSKTNTTTDLTIKKIDTNEIDKIYIKDGGRLKPINLTEQKELITALNLMGNTEMTLSFLLGIKTGARIMTIFTLRASFLRQYDVEDEAEIPVVIGGDSKVLNKGGKKMVIFIPGWIHNRIRIYYNSKRAVARRRLNNCTDPESQYIFLTRTGNPYYIGEKDESFLSYSEPPAGQAVRKFISVQLLPKLLEIGSNLTLSFHDLRATFGMNYVRHGINQIELGKLSKSGLLNNLRQRMGHSSIATTMIYLDYDFADKHEIKIQEEWELSLINNTDLTLMR